MYTVYMILFSVLILSFITGNVISLTERRFKKTKLILEKGTIIDEEVL